MATQSMQARKQTQSAPRPQRAEVKAPSMFKALPKSNVDGSYARKRQGARIVLPIENGCVMVVSDNHYYPGLTSRSHKASVALAELAKPYAIIVNGDVIDGASVSRWPVSSFTEMRERPLLSAELGESAARLKDYENLDFVRYYTWNLGNHDARFETKLAENVPQYQGIDGFTLKDRFPGWLPAWRTDFCAAPDAPPEVIVKHRFKNGMHAGQNNALWSGCSVVTGHDHMLKAYPITTSRGMVWGIHAGTCAPIDSPHFVNYTEDNVVNWQEGFVFLHFRDGKFVGPELVHVQADGTVLFRGRIFKAS